MLIGVRRRRRPSSQASVPCGRIQRFPMGGDSRFDIVREVGIDRRSGSGRHSSDALGDGPAHRSIRADGGKIAHRIGFAAVWSFYILLVTFMGISPGGARERTTFCWQLSWASAPEGREKELHFAGSFHGHQPRRGARKNPILLVAFMGISPGGARESSPWREPWEPTRTARSPGGAKEPFHGDSPIAGHEGPSYAPTGLARLWAGPTGLTAWAIF